MEKMKTNKKFSDFAQESGPLEGIKSKLDNILDKEVLILDFRINKSKFKEGNYLTLQYENDGKKHILFTSSGILISQIQKYANNLPFYTTIKHINNYYTMT